MYKHKSMFRKWKGMNKNVQCNNEMKSFNQK